MKTLSKDDLYNNISQFLDTRGIKLKRGSYSQALQNGCSLLADAINLGQESVEFARTEIDRKLDQMRQVVHEATAPRDTKAEAAPAASASNSQAAPGRAAGTSRTTRKAAEIKTEGLKRQAAARRKRAAVKARGKHLK